MQERRTQLTLYQIPILSFKFQVEPQAECAAGPFLCGGLLRHFLHIPVPWRAGCVQVCEARCGDPGHRCHSHIPTGLVRAQNHLQILNSDAQTYISVICNYVFEVN